jgi:hypothetical protein
VHDEHGIAHPSACITRRLPKRATVQPKLGEDFATGEAKVLDDEVTFGGRHGLRGNASHEHQAERKNRERLAHGNSVHRPTSIADRRLDQAGVLRRGN